MDSAASLNDDGVARRNGLVQAPPFSSCRPGLRLGGAPLPDVAAHVEHAVRADSALVAVHGGRAAHAVLANVALGRRGLVAPRVDGAPGATRGLLPLLPGRQRLPRPLGIRGGVVPGHEDHGMVAAIRGRPPVLPVLRRRVTGGRDEPRVLVVGHGVDVDVEGRQPDGLIAWPRQENAPVDLRHGAAVDRMANVAFPDRLGDAAVLLGHERVAGEEGEACLRVGIAARQRGVESRLVDRPRTDVLLAPLPTWRSFAH